MDPHHGLLLLLTALVAAALVLLALALARLLPKGSQSPPGSLAEYGRAWCVQQAVPFVDKVVGVFGAMDNRMLAPLEKSYMDWGVRLPVIVVSFIYPSKAVLTLGHVLNIISWAQWMPAVWDHMCWAALIEIVFVLAVLQGGSSSAVAGRFLPAAQAMLTVLYFSAAFWKLTTSWYDTYTSCAPVLLSELLSGLAPPSVLPAGSSVANLLLYISPVFVAALEFAVPSAVMINPPAGVLLALIFHQTINLMPMTYAGGFSLAMCTRMVIFVPGALSAAMKSTAPLMVPSAIVAAVASIMLAVHGRLDSAGFSFLLLTLLYLRGLSSAGSQPLPGGKLVLVAALLAFVYGFLAPIFGLMAMASSTMYGNVRQFGGTNHLLVPTGLLQEWHSSDGDDAFGGGMVRVDFTNSSVLQQLTPADATGQLPKHARALLEGINASGFYFELYSARNYFGRRGDLEASALHNRGSDGPRMEDPPYAQPAYELRRVLALARSPGEAFKLVYTKLPAKGTPGSYRDFRGEQVTLEQDASGARTCTVGKQPCGKNEIALLPPPPRWLTWMLHPYPMPLLPGDAGEVHCST